MKILNLYAGIGGNRKLWGDSHDITAVELQPDIAAIYSDLYPNDTIIVGDAHEYLINHFDKFDFIWTSPPCTTHSRIRYCMTKAKNMGLKTQKKYPDLTLYQQIIFLKNYIKENQFFVVENVLPYYEPLIAPTANFDRHLFWTNFKIPRKPKNNQGQNIEFLSTKKTHYGFSLNNYKTSIRKVQILRNLVNPELGLYLLNCANGVFEYNDKSNEPELPFGSQN